MRERHAANAAGDWYVDTQCINCKAAQTVAPGLIVEREGQSVFAHQPATEAERVLAWRARLLCPTASVHAERAAAPDEAVFPEPMTEQVWRLGYNARHSWGAHSFLIERASGNAMIDAPRWTEHVVAAIEARGGLALVLLTHRDDVADAERYAKHFGARVFIHEDDRAAAPYASDLLRGRAPTPLGEDLLAIPVPGHTKGSVAFLFDGRCLFAGDSLSWDFTTDDLRASKHVCWYSWPEQTKSLRDLAAHSFEWVFAGHGGSKHLPRAEMRTRLLALTERMAAQ
ncbi:MAG TPA: MBL fold metallo-hydrolase [Stellaceae bacterium]|jgi:glyoxylase-like metal-dependent hydrolase (beta-lactamase superfamily II)